MKKFSIDIKTARQLEAMRLANSWSWKQMYAYYFGTGVEQADDVSDKDADALRKQVERKKNKVPYSEVAEGVLEPSSFSNERTITYEVDGDETVSATGTVYLDEKLDQRSDAKKLILALFDEFNLDPKRYEIKKYTPSYVKGRFKVWARFEKRNYNPYDEEEVIERYEKLLQSIGSLKLPTVRKIDVDNILVINLADVHWNKLPFMGFDGDYLANFEQMIYDKVSEIVMHSKSMPISRAVITIGHDFFQTNDGRGTTKKGTSVSNVMEYKDMFDYGVRILANAVNLVAQHYIVDAYYVLANHDNDAGWHAARELKLLFKNTQHINVIADKTPFHYIEWGNTLIELVHENLVSGKGRSSMTIVAREAWGRTKYHYSIGGHLHGEFTTREGNGIVTMGSRALSDTDEWHYLNGYLGNIRGVQSYVFNKDNGHVATFNANL